MPNRKDLKTIGSIIVIALLLFVIARLLPRKDISTRTADVTLAPDAVVYVTPEATEEKGEKKETTEPVPDLTVSPAATPDNDQKDNKLSGNMRLLQIKRKTR